MKVSEYRDSCEYNPQTKRACWTDEEGHAEAALIVGANGQWRLCATCAALPEFKQFRVRRLIKGD